MRNPFRIWLPAIAGRVALLVLLLAPALVLGQGRRSEELLYDAEAPFRCEAWNAPSTDTAMSRLDVHLWVQPGLLIFVRVPGDTSATPFIGKADISIEVFDSTHTARARKFIESRISSSSTDNLAGHAKTLEESASFDLPPGTYTVTAEVTDVESQRRTSREQRVTLRSYRPGPLQASSLFWCADSARTGPTDGAVRFLGSVLPLGQTARGYVASSGVVPGESLHVVLRILRSIKDVKTVVLQDSFWTRGAAGVVPSADTVAGCRYYPAGRLNAGIVTIAVPFAADTLPQGPYSAELVVVEGGRSATVRQDFAVQWAGMPRTLASLPRAVQALQYLLSKEEYATLHGQDAAAQRRSFEAFWRKKNPTPKSAFNPYMEEYYRRADIAAQDFATIRNPNGITTDRGKVLILYGQPASKERVLATSSAPREVWNYPALNRSLIFVDEKRTGDYTLLTEQ